MEFHFIHALVLTPFEASLTPLNWKNLSEQDYPIHVLYSKEQNRIIFHSDNQKCDCAQEISKIQSLLTKLGISIALQQQIIVLNDDENEYCTKDVIRHLNL